MARATAGSSGIGLTTWQTSSRARLKLAWVFSSLKKIRSNIALLPGLNSAVFMSPVFVPSQDQVLKSGCKSSLYCADSKGDENITWECKFMLFEPFRNYLSSLNLYNVANHPGTKLVRMVFKSRKRMKIHCRLLTFFNNQSLAIKGNQPLQLLSLDQWNRK